MRIFVIRNSITNDIEADLLLKPQIKKNLTFKKRKDDDVETGDGRVEFTDPGDAIKFFHNIKALNQGGRKNRGNKRFT